MLQVAQIATYFTSKHIKIGTHLPLYASVYQEPSSIASYWRLAVNVTGTIHSDMTGIRRDKEPGPESGGYMVRCDPEVCNFIFK